ncbi:hypothetical protein GCM10010464_20410 [Pseudonocardia yunnanensis]|uniref:Uncharacterized protein n=1 Tax=Pseudonocardia yunnanensis TaxID=58107 RepID=A0ABW4EPC2_9PSEU
MWTTRKAVRLLPDVNSVQRIWRDLETMSRHQILSLDLDHEIYGRAPLGVDPQVSPAS